MPSALVALACWSMSTRRVLIFLRASAADKFTAVVVLPTPPFWFAIENIFAGIVCFILSLS